MHDTRVVRAAEKDSLFPQAEQFLLPHEKSCCILMQSVLQKSGCVFVILKKAGHSREEIAGVFSLSDGKSLSICIPFFSDEINTALISFLRDTAVFCIAGASREVKKMQELVFQSQNILAEDERSMILMEYDPKTQKKENHPPVKIQQCEPADADELFPLHLAYVSEEVLPPWKQPFPASERIQLEHSLKARRIFAAVHDGTICAKAHISAETHSFVQIGGVFTKPEFRSNGYASQLVHEIARAFWQQHLRTVLFVNEKNKSALRAYTNAAFRPFVTYRIAYFKPSARIS